MGLFIGIFLQICSLSRFARFFALAGRPQRTPPQFPLSSGIQTPRRSFYLGLRHQEIEARVLAPPGCVGGTVFLCGHITTVAAVPHPHLLPRSRSLFALSCSIPIRGVKDFLGMLAPWHSVLVPLRFPTSPSKVLSI